MKQFDFIRSYNQLKQQPEFILDAILLHEFKADEINKFSYTVKIQAAWDILGEVEPQII